MLFFQLLISFSLIYFPLIKSSNLLAKSKISNVAFEKDLKDAAFDNKDIEISFKSLSYHEIIKYYEFQIENYAKQLVKHKIAKNLSEGIEFAKKEIGEDVSKFYKEDNQHLYSISIENSKIGFIEFYEEASFSPNLAWLDYIYIDEPYRNNGYAKKALNKMEEELKSLGIKKVGLNVFNENKTALNLYKNLGYSISKSYENEAGEIRNVLMEKKL